MFTKKWRSSEREYGVIIERDVRIRMRDGVTLDADIMRPDSNGKFPAICGFHIFRKDLQSAPIRPAAINLTNGGMEAGDYNFFVRRGYAQVIVSQRGTGNSGGKWCVYAADEQQDDYEVVEWVAQQPWCSGSVGTHGPSVFSITAQQVAALSPPSLKCIFAPWGYTDFYRDKFYQGGICSYGFTKNLIRHPFRVYSWTREKVGDSKFKELIDEALQDHEIISVPFLVDCLKNPEKDRNAIIVDLILNRFEGPYWQERSVKLDAIKVPSYIGACWGTYGLHMRGAFHGWDRIKAPKKMIIGPPVYMDRPVYQLQYEALRWFDHWLKGIDNGVMEEPPIRLFVPGAGEWKAAEEWPLPETKWTPFYLHSRGLLSEHEFFPNEGYSTFEDSPQCRESLKFLSPPMVENTEVIGPIVLKIYASTTDDEILWFISLLDIGPTNEETLLTRGWLRGSQRAVDWERSKPWEPFHPHTKREILKPGEIYEFEINVGPTTNLFKEGHRIGLRVKCVDDEEPKTALEVFATGHIWRDRPSMVTVYHNTDYPSCLFLPVTKGNIMGTFMSGGKVPPVIGTIGPRWP